MKSLAVVDIKDKFFESLRNSIMDIDGGHLYSKLWFCGIEPGGKIDSKTYEEWITKINKNSSYPVMDFRIKDFKIPFFHKDITQWEFDAKIKAVISGWAGENYTLNYNQDAPVFKLNLFPLNAARVSYWSVDHKNITGCTLKSEYYGRCIAHRFQLIRELTIKGDPNVIVCIGRDHINEFIYAFWGEEGFWEEDGTKVVHQTTHRLPSGLELQVYQRAGYPTLIGTPFFGYYKYCIKSPEDLFEIGNFIKNYFLHFPDKPIST